MEHQADVHPQLRLILPDAGPGCEKNGRRAIWAVTTRSARYQVPVAVLPTAKSLSAFSLKTQSDRLLDCDIATEEERTRVSNRFDADYPILARTLAARRYNLKGTIASLERRLANLPADQAELVPKLA